MKQFYALFLLLFACVPVLGNGLTLSNSEDFNCPSRTAEIFAIQQPSKCVHPYGGEMSARLRDANGTIITQDLQYAWYDANYPGNEAYKIGVGAKVTKVPPGTYLVIITDTRLGCTYFSAPVTLEKPVTPWFEVEYLENVIGCDAAPYGRIKLNSENRWKARWFHGEEIGTGNGIPKYLSLDRFEELPPGTYTVVYEDVNSGCFSDPFTFTIGGYPITPTVNASIVADTTCTTGSGSISLTASTPAPGTEPERGYTYEWRDANGNLLPQYTNLATATGLPAGTYTIKVTGDYNDDAYECSSIVSFTVPHQPSRPVISLQNTPNTICSGSAYNGTITVNVTYKGQVVTNFSNYTFRWTDANGNTGTVSGTNLIPNLNGGTYTVVATEVSLGCDSDQATTTLNNQLPDQNFALLVTPQTTCAGTPNGALEISNYSISPASSTQPTYTWYIGTNTDPATGTRLPTANLSSSTRAISLTGGQTYTVVATDPASGCTVSRSMTVPLQEGVVTVVATPTPNSICSPATAKNGRIQVTEVRFNNVVVTDLTGYTFSWFVEGSTTPISGQTGTSLTGREAGRYQVRATRTDLGCISDPLTVEIVDQLPVQTLTLNATPQTSCDANNPNGRIDAIYSISPASTGTVTYRWFPGSTATGTPLSFTGASATGLTGGQTYTVQVTDGASGCSIVRSVTVPLQQGVVTVAATPTPNSICLPASAKNGRIQVTEVRFNNVVVTDLTGYTFSWYLEGSTTAIKEGPDPSLTGREAGRYQVRATRTDLGCISDPLTVEIVDQLPVQTLTLNATPQTSCDANNPNGRIDAIYSISPASTGTVTYRWFPGSTATGTPLSFTGASATGLTGGQTYTVEATDGASGCSIVRSVTVPLQQPAIALTAQVTDNTICAADRKNGAIQASVTYNGSPVTDLTGYTFSWYVEGSTTAIQNETGPSLTGRAAGRYQVRVLHNELQCPSDPITAEIKDVLPALALTLDPTDQTSCNGTPNGAIDASLSIDGTTAGNGYTLEWFLGTGTTTALSANNFSGNTAFNIAGATYYTVRATHTESGCQTISSVFVPARDGIVTFDYVAYANSICDPELAVPGVYNGRIEIPTVYFNGDDDNANLSNYSFSWWQEASGSFIRLDGQTGSTLANIEPGRYQVEIRRTDLDCTTGRITIEVPNETVDPQLTLQIGQQQLYCVAPYSGIINASITVGGNPVNLSDYRFEWFRGTTIYGTKLSFTGNQATELDKGYYTVRAINTLTGCEDIEVIYMPEQLTTPLTSLAVQQIEGCLAEERGSFTATVMEGATEADYSNYTFHWYRGQTASGTPLATKSRLLDGLDGGDPLPSDYYTVVAVNEVTRCEALPQTGFLKAPVAVSNDYIINRRPSACNIDYGIATVWVVDEHGNANTTDYTFEWYEGRPTDPKANFYTDPKVEFTGDRLALLPRADYDMTTNIVGTVYPASTASYEGPTAYGLESGVYTVVITDSEGCKSMMEVVIAFENAPESLVMRLEHVEDCEGSFGGVGVKAVDVNDVPFPDQSRYAFFLYRGSNVMQSALINQNPVFGPVGTSDETYFGPSTGFDLEPGFYTIIAVDYFGSECSSTSRSFEIYQIAQPPVVSAGAIVASSMCEGGNGAATLTISNAEYTPGQLDYAISEVSIRWTSWPGSDAGDNTNRPADVTGALLQANDPSNPDYKQVIRTFSGLAAGTYELMVTGDTGCETPLTLVIPGAPVQPTVVATPINQTYCDPANGSIDITSVNGGSPNVADYTFYLYNGQENLANGNHMATGSLADMEALQLPNATYYLVAVQNLSTGPGSGCSSAPVELRIRNVSVYPQVVLAVNPNESCDPNEQTGEVSATISSATGTFSYSWYQVEANDNLLPRGNGTVTAGPIPTTLYLSELGPGLYRIEIVAENGCPVWAEMQLGNYIQVPVITQVTASNQTTCDDDQANGTLTVEEITYANSIYNATTGFGDFSFVWYLNGVELTDFTGPALTNRIAGDYSVEVFKIENPSKFCRSAPYTIEVEKVPLYPSVLAVRTQVNNACDVPYTGAIEVDMAFQTSYSYVLLHEDGTPTGFAGTDVTAALLQFTALDGGEYRLEISQANGCPLVQEITVPEAEILPVVLTVEATNQTSCSDAAADADGTLEITAIGYSDGAAAVLADFSFSWTGVDINGNTFTGSGTSLSGLVAGTYTVVATKNNTPPGAGCQSAPFTIEVQKVPLYPSVLAVRTQVNNACDVPYTGAIEVDMAFQTSYSYVLLHEDGTPTGFAGTDVTAALLQFTALDGGEYRLEISQANGCPLVQEITVPEAEILPVVLTVEATNQTSCSDAAADADGTLEITAIGYSDGAAAVLADFSFSWTGVDINGNTFTGSGTSLSGLVAGTYTVVATKNNTPPGAGCQSAPFTIEVQKVPLYPALADIETEPNTACDASYTGVIRVNTVTFQTSYSYRLLFENGSSTGLEATDVSLASLQFTGMAPGTYQLEIQQLNGCPISQLITVGEALLQPVIMAATSSSQTTCVGGDGGAEVISITYNGVETDISEFTWVWYASDMSTVVGTDYRILTGLEAGTYYVVATKKDNPGSGCASAPYEVQISHKPEYPTIALDGVDNTSCLATAGNGTLTATITDFGTSYSYTLYLNNAPTAYSGTGQTAGTLSFSNLLEGEYRLVIVPQNGCQLEAIRTLERQDISGEISLAAQDQSTCNADGSIDVNQILFAGQTYSGADILANFELVLIDAAGNRLTDVALPTTTGARFVALVSGTYTVEATRRQPVSGTAIGQGCSVTSMIGVGDVSVEPELSLTAFRMISECFGSPFGMLSVSVDGYTHQNVPAHYTISWFYRQTITAVEDPNNPGTYIYTPEPALLAGRTSLMEDNLVAGFYTIRITDAITGCSTEMEYAVEQVEVEIAIRATANDQTKCEPENGEIFVEVINEREIIERLGYLPTFDFEVYRGEQTDLSGELVDGTNAAALYSRGSYVAYTYTIYTWFNGQAHDLQNCHAIDQVVVNYIDHTPDLRAEQEAILTICDPDRPNASATAYIGDGRLTEGYIFNWYLGEIHDDNLYSTGPVATELSLGTYWVEVIDTFTGCTNQMSVEITAEYPDVPFVDAMLRATIATSCAAPNGSLEVIVANRDGFDFAWYRGEVVDEANRMPNGTFSYLQEGLAEGWYTVVATDLANGCVSNSVSKYLGGEYIFPEYEILLTPASCATPGTARIVDLTGTLREFYIYDAQGNLVGDHTAPFSGIAGNYLLKVISLDGCEKSEPFTITDTVAPFNAITPNGDGQNDYFHFSCIDLYPENLLRIYNRAGGLVFELNGYDNQLNVFTGKGNRGLYLGDKDLPAGTYFWVLFRNNTNEKPKTGFLELIR
jgi:gliding motility-associated-like protein